jgi:hypothetical protein
VVIFGHVLQLPLGPIEDQPIVVAVQVAHPDSDVPAAKPQEGSDSNNDLGDPSVPIEDGDVVALAQAAGGAAGSPERQRSGTAITSGV